MKKEFLDIKIIMCDIDGTLLSEKGYVSPANISAIKKIREKGIMFGLSTGRDVHSVLASLSRWGIDGLVDAVVGSGGAEIYDRKTNIKKDGYSLDEKHVMEIYHHFKDMDVNFSIPYDGVLYALKDDHHIQQLAEFDHEPYKVLPLDEFLQLPLLKFMIVCDPETMKHVVERSKELHSSEYTSSALVTASVLYEFMDPRISKANGLKELLETYGLHMQQLCTFGDADNDYDMTKEAGIGIAMANACERTKSVADYICGYCEEDGVARFIEENLV